VWCRLAGSHTAATPITIRVTGDDDSGLLLGAQLIGRRGAEIAKRVDIYATALFHAMSVDAVGELDLSYTPPLGSPWDAVQMATQAWVHEHQLTDQREALTVSVPMRSNAGSRCTIGCKGRKRPAQQLVIDVVASPVEDFADEVGDRVGE
jgi:hypothetical protein